MDSLPVEILTEIATKDLESCNAMLAIPLFARFSVNHKKYLQERFFIHEKDQYNETWKLKSTKLLHSCDGPARININGTKEWYRNGLRHRIGGPAVIKKKLRLYVEEWWVNGKRHREGVDGAESLESLPAIITRESRDSDKIYDKQWYYKGKRHRVDGPAIDWGNGRYEWWVNGVRHREDGPAVEDRLPGYYIKGKAVSPLLPPEVSSLDNDVINDNVINEPGDTSAENDHDFYYPFDWT